MNKNIKELDKLEMQDLLADYAFGRLSQNENVIFEANIDKYPDLKFEVNEIKEVFGKIEELDFNEVLRQRSRNISVKVQAKKAKKTKRQYNTEYIFKYLLPSLGIFSIMLIAYFVNNNTNESLPLNEQSNNTNTFAISSKDLLQVSLNDKEIDEVSSYLADDSGENSVYNIDLLNQETQSELNTKEEEKILLSLSNNISQATTNHDLINEIKLLNENDILELLGEISDVEFDS